MLKAENIVSSHQYRIAGFVVWLLICVLLSRYFQIQILDVFRVRRVLILVEVVPFDLRAFGLIVTCAY